jgi:ABC-type transport system substrate-binding protein
LYLPHPAQVAQEIQAQLAQIGVTVIPQPMESSAFIQAVQAGQLGMFMLGWAVDYPDATNFYDPHFTSASKNFGNVYPDLEAAIYAAGQVADPVQRTTLYASVAALVKQHVPMIPIAHGSTGIAYKAAVGGAQASPLAYEMFNLMSVPGQPALNFIQVAEPVSLYCSDQTDAESMRACYHIFDTLYWFNPGTADLVPAAAGSYTTSADLKTWTFTLKKNLKFSNGTALDANDVVETFVVQWDASNPLHTGNTGDFEYFRALFARLLNEP